MMKSNLTNGAFWAATGERAIGTFAQALLAVIGAGAMSIIAVDWPAAIGTAALAAALSVLKSVTAGTIGDGPGLGTAETLTAHHETN